MKILYRKIAVGTSLIIVMLLLYLIPSKNNNIEIEQQLEYVYSNDLEAIYLLDNNDMVTRSKISVNNDSEISKSKDLIEGLIIDGKKKEILPNGFKGLVPTGTKLIDISLSNGILKIDFSKEFNNVKKEYEEKMIEAITYTLTSIEGIDKIAIYVEGEKLQYLPNSKKKIPNYLDKNYGINKKYELTTLNNIDSYTIYYVMNYDDTAYYTPVTKYINNQGQDKVKIIIDELATSLSYESNLMSYLDTNIKLLDYEIIDDKIKLNFNDLILSDITNNLILEEVMYTIGLSLCEELELEEVIFMANSKEISTFSLKSLD